MAACSLNRGVRRGGPLHSGAWACPLANFLWLTAPRWALPALLLAGLLAGAPASAQLRLGRLSDLPGTAYRSARARESYERGLWALYNGLYAEAAAEFRSVTRLDPRFAPAYPRLAAAYLNAGLPDRAAEALALVPSLTTRAARRVRLLVTAEQARLKRDHLLQEALYGLMAGESRMDAEAHTLLGRARVALAKPAQAEQSFRQAIAVNARYFPAYHELGLLQERQGKLNQALSRMRRYAALSGSGQALRALGRVYDELGRYAEARRCYAQASTRDPEATHGMLCTARSFLRQGNLASALWWASTALKRARTGRARVDAHSLLGQVHRLRGDWQRVVFESDAIRREVSQGVEIATYYHGLSLVGRRRLAAARTAWRRMRDLVSRRTGPQGDWTPEAHDLGAGVLSAGGDPLGAARELRGAIAWLSRSSPSSDLRQPLSFYWRRLGDVTYQAGRLANAGRAYRRALELDHGDGLALYGLGLVSLKRRQPSQARYYLRRFLALWTAAPATLPQVAQARRLLGTAAASASLQSP